MAMVLDCNIYRRPILSLRRFARRFAVLLKVYIVIIQQVMYSFHAALAYYILVVSHTTLNTNEI